MPALTQHQLALEVPEQSCSDRLTIWDASVYANGITVDCEKLEIKIPGYSTVYTHLYTDSPNPLEYNFNNINNYNSWNFNAYKIISISGDDLILKVSNKANNIINDGNITALPGVLNSLHIISLARNKTNSPPS